MTIKKNHIKNYAWNPLEKEEIEELQWLSNVEQGLTKNKISIIYVGNDHDFHYYLLDSLKKHKFSKTPQLVWVHNLQQVKTEIQKNWNVGVVIFDLKEERQCFEWKQELIKSFGGHNFKVICRYKQKSMPKINMDPHEQLFWYQHAFCHSSQFESHIRYYLQEILKSHESQDKNVKLESINWFLKRMIKDSLFESSIENLIQKLEEEKNIRYWVEIINDDDFQEIKASPVNRDLVDFMNLSPVCFQPSERVQCEVIFEKETNLRKNWSIRLWSLKGVDEKPNGIYSNSIKDLLTSCCIGYVKFKEKQEELTSDSVTGLLNREGLVKKIELKLKKKKELLGPKFKDEEYVFFLMSLAGFNEINSVLGHAAGDLVLRESGQKLKEYAKNKPFGRITSDSFGWLMKKNEYNAKEFEKMFSDPIQTALGDYRIRVRVGAAYIEDATIESISDALKKAATAAKQSKATRFIGGKPFWFEENAQTEKDNSDRLFFMQRFNETITHKKGLNIHFQPQYSLKNGKMIGAEALIRWSFDGMNVSPDRFIPWAEQAGMARCLSDFALEESCKLLKELKEKNLQLHHISVNISALDFDYNSELIERVKKTLNEYNIAPEQIRLEITETAAANNPENMKEIVAELRQYGISFAIDDFGSGYSSISQLVALELDELKIDKSFIQSLGKTMPGNKLSGFARMIIDLAKSMNLEIVAEGIETEQQRDILRELGANYGQGWLWSKALTKEDFINLLLNSKNV